jgi:hypothetical protein
MNDNALLVILAVITGVAILLIEKIFDDAKDRIRRAEDRSEQAEAKAQQATVVAQDAMKIAERAYVSARGGGGG